MTVMTNIDDIGTHSISSLFIVHHALKQGTWFCISTLRERKLSDARPTYDEFNAYLIGRLTRSKLEPC